jgi:pyruvyltransferase
MSRVASFLRRISGHFAPPIPLKQFTGFPNAGDVASGRLVAAITGRKVTLLGKEANPTVNLTGIGSILEWADAESIVWGTGMMFPLGQPLAPPRRLLAVRGALTRKRLAELGITPPDLVGDPGVLASEFLPQPTVHRRGVCIIPHRKDLQDPWVLQAQAAGVTLIDPQWPLDTYLSTLNSHEIVLSSSLHGIIFAHAYGIPAAWVELSDLLGSGFKFRDYYSSIGYADDSRLPRFSATAEVQRVIDGATLPIAQIDKARLVSVLREAAAEV